MLNPRSCSGGILRTYRTTPTGERLDFVHDTPVEEFPAALCAYQGRLLAGIGQRLRLYDMGKKKLLKKGENRVRFTFLLRLICRQGVYIELAFDII